MSKMIRDNVTYRPEEDRMPMLVLVLVQQKWLVEHAQEVAVSGVLVCEESVTAFLAVWEGSLTVVDGLTHVVGNVLVGCLQSHWCTGTQKSSLYLLGWPLTVDLPQFWTPSKHRTYKKMIYIWCRNRVCLWFSASLWRYLYRELKKVTFINTS